MSKRKVIIDTDPGYDDTCAIALASLSSEKIDLLAITTVAGNQTSEKVSKNALNLANYLGLTCPIGKGMTGPLFSPLVVAPHVHGETGLDNVNLSPSLNTTSFDKRHAVNLIIDLCKENPPNSITLVTIGPLTNIAMALKLEPEIKKHIQEISIMGGSILYGNCTPAAEFNIHADPEAAQIVFSSGIPIKMHGLDVTVPCFCTEEVIQRMKKLGTKHGEMFCQCVSNCNENLRKCFPHVKWSSAHDSVAVMGVIDDSMISYKDMYVEVETLKGCCYGRTVCDQFGSMGKKSNAKVAVNIDVNKFWDTVEKIYSKGPALENK